MCSECINVPLGFVFLVIADTRDFAEGWGVPHLSRKEQGKYKVSTYLTKAISGEADEFIQFFFVKGKDALGPECTTINCGIKDVNG